MLRSSGLPSTFAADSFRRKPRLRMSKADDVRRMMRFDFEKGGEYAAFIENMMDYNRNSRDYRQASAAVSGMVEFLKRL